jgi:hypothetical protein
MRDLDLHGAAVSKQAGEAEALEPAELEALYAWIDGVPLSRPKRNFARDFSDGVLVAEVVRHFVPRLVEMHNYIPAQSVAQKQSNWETVQAKLLKKLKMRITPAQIQAIASAKPMHIEPVLHQLRFKIEAFLANVGGGGAAAAGDGGAGERSRAERDRKRAEREEARAARDAARAAKIAERKNRPPVDPWSKLHGGVSQDIATAAPTRAGGRADGHGHQPAVPAPAPAPRPPGQPRRRGRRSEPQLGVEPPVGASPGELNLWHRQHAAAQGGEAQQHKTSHAAARHKSLAAPAAQAAATRTGKQAGMRGARAQGDSVSGGGSAVGNGAASGDFDGALLAEKDKVIRDVRKTFSSCSDKIASIEQMLGLGGAGAGGSYYLAAPGPGSAPAAPQVGPSYAETQYNAGW